MTDYYNIMSAVLKLSSSAHSTLPLGGYGLKEKK